MKNLVNNQSDRSIHIMNRVSFESDYNNGTLPEILNRLCAENDIKTSGYGADPFTESAKGKIRQAIGIPDADIFFLIGGTQTNQTIIDAMLLGCEGVIASESAHINVHESGAIEAYGHKVLVISSEGSKLTAEGIDKYMSAFYADETYPHMVLPRMVYITMPTELGMLYTKQEIQEIKSVCQHYNLLLYVDGARLGYGLTSSKSDVDLAWLAQNVDVFYIGGTKVGAMFGEAVVFTNTKAPRAFFTTIKRHGALLAKGRILGLQFDTLFTNNLYFNVARHANIMAERLREIFIKYGKKIGVDSPTNQQFIILTSQEKSELMKSVTFEVWSPLADNNLLCRFVTSWATTEEDLEALEKALSNL